MTQNDYDEELYKHHFRVSIFGSARIKPDDPLYSDVFKLAKLIASENIDVVTGGGPGLMEAANKGHQAGRKDNSTHSLGLNIKLPHEQGANRHLDIIKDFDRFSRRLDNFMLLSNAVVVAPGGIGTVLELFYTWQLVQVKHICTIPIILLGDMWKPLLSWIREWLVNKQRISESDLDNIFIASTVDDAYKIINHFYEAFEKGEGLKCSNVDKYGIMLK